MSVSLSCKRLRRPLSWDFLQEALLVLLLLKLSLNSSQLSSTCTSILSLSLCLSPTSFHFGGNLVILCLSEPNLSSPFPMAAVLESLPVPRVSALRASPSSPAASAVSVAGRKTAGLLPEFRGLKIQTRAPRLTLASGRRGQRIARRSIVCETQETAVIVPAVTDSTWQSEVLGADLPVLVEFWAPWCGPCRMIHPIIDELSKDYAEKLKCFKVNTDESPLIATQYGIRSIPTVIIFKNGEKKDAIIGAVPKTTLIASIDKFL